MDNEAFACVKERCFGASGSDKMYLQMRTEACRTMVHLTMNNEANKLSLVRYPGMLEGLRERIADQQDAVSLPSFLS